MSAPMPSPPPSAGTLIFLHMPKAAGATLRKALFELYPGRQHFWIEPAGAARLASLERLSAMPFSRKQELKVVTGHVAFGLHRILAPQPSQYLTVLRDPVQRTRSLYQYARDTPDHALHDLACRASLLEFGTTPHLAAVDNLQTRLLAGGHLPAGNGLEPKPAVDERDFAHALGHLRTFAAVGTQERFDESVRLFAAHFGWGELPEPNNSHVAARPLPVDDGARAAIEEHNQYDARLHVEADRMLDRLAAA